jgi:hypothetical protein
MLVLPLCQKDCPDKIPPNLSTKLGEGADGEVFALHGEDNKVIKLSALFDYWDTNLAQEYSRIESVVKYIQSVPLPVYSKVFSFEKLIESQREIWGGKQQNYILYSYVMEKCFSLSEDEKKVFHSIVSHEDLGIEKNYSEPQIKKMLNGMSLGLDFDAERVIFFYRNFRKSPVRHLDLHVRNIMKDGSGNFKLIDFDRTTLEF